VPPGANKGSVDRPVSDAQTHSENGELFHYERLGWAQGFRRVAGVDEAGRGPLAGPVVAAAVILPRTGFSLPVADSKVLSMARRESLAQALWQAPDVHIGIGVVSAQEVDRVNILQATYLAMREAVAKLSPQPDFTLVDGLPGVGLSVPTEFIVKGDAKSASIAAASIVAKVHRDRMMIRFAGQYPGYGFTRNKGYGTREHLVALARLGATPIHRTSFSPVARVIAADAVQQEFRFDSGKA